MSNTPNLDRIHEPGDLKKLSPEQLVALCDEIRAFLLEKVSKTGGHLASNLGVIELTVALHRVCDSPRDKILFDVGHQCYTHKLLTGRRDGFDRLRQMGGISGFPNPRESKHDTFVAGHGNTAVSLAIGVAQAKKLKGEPGRVYAIVGDGAFTGGMVYEGLNNIEKLDNLTVILNDNEMSISRNVGSMARYLTRLRTAPEYYRVKENVQTALDSIPVVGEPLRRSLQGGKTLVRRALYHSTMFEDMGFQYVGPVDGHDVGQLVTLFTNLKDQSGPVFIHLLTKKGKGYAPAEKNPGEFHGVSAFDPALTADSLTDPEVTPKESFSNVFGQALTGIGKTDSRICAITAAMKYGVGLQFFQREFPQRFFDVGMAEQHAVTFAAGLASQGQLPVVAIYSTFLQRSFDPILHDVCLLRERVLFAVDRAGLVPGDGETHQGIYDPVYFSAAGIPLYSPANYAELSYWLEELLRDPQGPAAIRYPRGGESERLMRLGRCCEVFQKAYAAHNGGRLAIVSYGSETEDALNAAEQLSREGIGCDVYRLVQVFPIPPALAERLTAYNTVLFCEECVRWGGIGEHLVAALHEKGWKGKFLHRAIDPLAALPHATVPEMKRALGLDAGALVQTIKENLS